MTVRDVPAIVTGFTMEYYSHAESLAKDALCQGWPIHRYNYADRGSWIQNVAAKPDVVYAALTLLRRPVLWVDADSTILKGPDPEFWEGFRDVDVAGPLVTGERRDRKYYVGCLFFNWTEEAAHVARLWARACETQSEPIGDEVGLEEARRRTPHYHWATLPIEYAHLPKHGQPTDDTSIQMGISGEATKWMKGREIK